MQSETDLYEYQQYRAIDFLIGLFITLGASVVNALGLNITKLDFTRQEALPASARKADWKRGFWWLGLLLYIASQVVGSTLALEFMRAEYVAPLGSTSLIFNFVFAYFLVGTSITRTDILGTLVVVLGVCGTVVFGNIRLPSDFDKESNLSLSLLKQLWGRGDWIAYITVLELVTVTSFWFSRITHEVCMNRVEDERGDAEPREDRLGNGGRRGPEPEGWRANVQAVKKAHKVVRASIKQGLETWAQSRPDSTIRKAAGLCWSITGGLLAGQTLVFAKSAVKLVTSAIGKTDPDEANQFTSPLTWLIVILLVVCAVTQVYCLNASLRCYDSTFTVPIFFATYTTAGFINSLVYLDELKTYKTWVFVCIWLSIAVLIIGVVLLSMKKPAARKRAASLLQEEDGTNPNDPAAEPEFKKGQGWLGNVSIFKSDDPTTSAAEANGVIHGQPSQSDRRKQAGQQKLGDADSVLDSERPGMGAQDIELDEVDALDYEMGDGKPGQGLSDEDDDDFGDFKAGASRLSLRRQDS